MHECCTIHVLKFNEETIINNVSDVHVCTYSAHSKTFAQGYNSTGLALTWSKNTNANLQISKKFLPILDVLRIRIQVGIKPGSQL